MNHGSKPYSRLASALGTALLSATLGTQSACVQRPPGRWFAFEIVGNWDSHTFPTHVGEYQRHHIVLYERGLVDYSAVYRSTMEPLLNEVRIRVYKKQATLEAEFRRVQASIEGSANDVSREEENALTLTKNQESFQGRFARYVSNTAPPNEPPMMYKLIVVQQGEWFLQVLSIYPRDQQNIVETANQRLLDGVSWTDRPPDIPPS